MTTICPDCVEEGLVDLPPIALAQRCRRHILAAKAEVEPEEFDLELLRRAGLNHRGEP